MTKQKTALPVLGAKVPADLKEQVETYAAHRGRTPSGQLHFWIAVLMERPDLLDLIEHARDNNRHSPPGLNPKNNAAPRRDKSASAAK